MLIYHDYLSDWGSFYYVFQTLLSLLSVAGVIALCKIFSDCGKSWWKALIPAYWVYVFGEIVGDEEKGAAAMKYLLIDIGIALCSWLIAIIAIFIIRDAEWMVVLIMILVAIVAIIFGILYVIKVVQLREEFLAIAGLPAWLNAAWFFLPAVVQIYIAFFAERGDRRYNEPY